MGVERSGLWAPGITDYLSTDLASRGASIKENRYHRKSSCIIIVIIIIIIIIVIVIIIIIIIIIVIIIISGRSIIIVIAVTVIIIIILWSWPRFHAQCAATHTLSCDRDRQVPGP